MKTYYFLLGTTPELSLKELESVLSEKITPISARLVAVDLADKVKPQKLIAQLGGTIKIMEQVAKIKITNSEEILEHIVSLLSSNNKIKFSLVNFAKEDLVPSLSEVKQALNQAGTSSRYIESGQDGLSAAVLTHHQVTEIGVIKHGEELTICQTVSVQNIDDWSDRDRGRPYADRKSGMLPLKIARMMTNMALENKTKVSLLDPFCGSGSILAEAMMLSVDVVGCDISATAVTGTNENLTWLKIKYQLKNNVQVFQHDTSQPFPVSLKINAIVTEPFLGKQTPHDRDLKNIFRGLEKLYLGAFKQWTKILNADATVVIVFPQVITRSKKYSLEGLLDKLAALGYTTESGSVIYSRPQARVQRQIWKFKYKK